MKALGAVALGLPALLLATLVPVTPAPALEAESARYWRSVERICQTGVTAEATEAYRALTAALAREGTPTQLLVQVYSGLPLARRTQLIRTVLSNPHGNTTNFWGPRSPEHASMDCVQAR